MQVKQPCKIHLLAAARPNFVKIAPLYMVLKEQSWCEPEIIYIAQHPPGPMTTSIAEELGISRIDHIVEVGSNGDFGARFGAIIDGYSKLVQSERPDIVLVAGDVDTSLAAALTAKRLGNIPVAHLEAGLRSFDRSMPEEVNRILIDAISDIWLTPGDDATQRLTHGQSRPEERVHTVGNIMIDSLIKVLDPARGAKQCTGLGLAEGEFAIATFHRPANVDMPDDLSAVLGLLRSVADILPVLVPVHPRLAQNLKRLGLEDQLVHDNLIITEPLIYGDFINLVAKSRMVLTDSGGIQEETAYLGIPCFTYRNNTERPVTVANGTNRLVNRWDALPQIRGFVARDEAGNGQQRIAIPLWDGLTAYRTANALHAWWSGVS